MTAHLFALLLGCLSSLLSPLFAQEPTGPKPAPLTHAAVRGITFDHPAGLIVETTEDAAGTELTLKRRDDGGRSGLPWVTVRVYAPGLTPATALEINVRQRRERCRQDGRAFVEQPTRESIAGGACPGTEIIDSGGTVTFRTRLFALTVAGQTVLLSTLSAVTDDDLTRTLLAPVATSLR